MVAIKTAQELDLMHRAGEIVARALARLRELAGPGVTTKELDAAAEELIRDLGAEPSFKGYHGYPATVCASINEQIAHGIPGPRQLLEGDIVSFDVGAIWQGYQGDAAVTVAIGDVPAQVLRLLHTTEAALAAGIQAARGGARLGDVSHAIESVAKRDGFSVVREYGGHGIGRAMHEPPRIPNWGPAGRGLLLEPGMTLAVEPMFTNGGYRTRVLGDGWTVVTADGSLAAHFEHTIAITEDSATILTTL